MCKVAVAVAGSSGIGAAIAMSVKRDIGQPWDPHIAESVDERTKWLVLAVIDCATEVALIVMAAGLVSGLQMTLKKNIGVCSAFAWRLG